ncbi:MAG: pyridoxal phosphate-dependent class II aminotransferase [Rhodobacteraceae bacterium]|nr:pyridoxal phosphate-dependent class II aminotransferase [Paracoccaceae bacterium]
MSRAQRDHGGGLDAAVEGFGGARGEWLDLSTGINPVPYPLPDIPGNTWAALPDSAGQQELLIAARKFWQAPDSAGILAASGVSALISQLPRLAGPATVGISNPTYNEHEAAFRSHGWVPESSGSANVYVHPNNPDGRLFDSEDIKKRHRVLTIIDESFCDVCPENSLIHLTEKKGVIVLKGLGKFWGLAGLRLGFAIARPDTIARLANMLGPWAVSGPAQYVGTSALSDHNWATNTRQRLTQDAAKLDKIVCGSRAQLSGGTSLFRLYEVGEAKRVQDMLAKRHIWSRVFPYSEGLLRLGLPGNEDGWCRLESAVKEL